MAVDRIYEHIDPFEAINAVALCVRSAPGIDHLALVRATMSFLGIQRMTDNIRALVEETIAAAVGSGRVTRTEIGTYTAT